LGEILKTRNDKQAIIKREKLRTKQTYKSMKYCPFVASEGTKCERWVDFFGSYAKMEMDGRNKGTKKSERKLIEKLEN